jgi:hypothetical protein
MQHDFGAGKEIFTGSIKAHMRPSERASKDSLPSHY